MEFSIANLTISEIAYEGELGLSLPKVVFAFKQLLETTDHSCGPRMGKSELGVDRENTGRKCCGEIVFFQRTVS